MGVVIGETAEVGDDVLHLPGRHAGRHQPEQRQAPPDAGQHVVVGSGAKVLGAITLGDHMRVGSGSVVVKSSPPRSTIVGIPGRALEEGEEEGRRPGHELEHNRIPDPTARAITALHEQVGELARELAELRQQPVFVAVPRGLTAEQVEQAFRSMSEPLEEPRGNGGADPGAGI